MTKEELIWAYHTTPNIFTEIFINNLDEPKYCEMVKKYFDIIQECLSDRIVRGTKND